MENDSPPSSSEINEMLPYESDEEDCGMADDWNEVIACEHLLQP